MGAVGGSEGPAPAGRSDPSPRARDVVRVFPWMVGGYVYGVRHAPTLASRAYTLLILGTLTVLAPVLLLLIVPPPSVPILLFDLVVYACLLLPMGGLSVMCGRGRRAYMPATRDAVLMVREVQGQWRVENFFAAHPKRSNTSPLWEYTVPALVKRADQEGILIVATAMNEKLARFYCSRVPGLEPGGGTAGMGRVKLVRVPHPSA